ncbi:MAG: glycosyltransferase [Bacilli bacterium]|nr:glycosyltransferase [Bacilli bacterium]
MKKVTILSLHLGFGGIEKSVASLANMLIDNYEVEIMSVYKLYDKPSFYINDKVKIKYLLNDLPNKKEVKEALKKHNIITLTKELTKSLKVLYLRKNKTIKYILNNNSDIIISTRDIFNKWLGQYGRKNVYKIGWEHNHHHNDMNYAKKIIKSCKNLDRLVLVSNSLQKFYDDKMRNYKCRCIYIPNVIEDIPKNSSSLKNKNLISVGRLSKEKGYSDLLEIYNEIHKKYPDWNLDIIGSGNEEEKLSNYIKKNNLEGSVTLHGFQQKEYIYDHLTKSSIYLMTSYTESFGIVLIEAMSVGLPCIAFTSAEGANEIITSGYNGYLIKNRNKESYIKKIEDLIEDYDTRKKLGKNAKESILKYKSDIVKEDWIDLIEKRR